MLFGQRQQLVICVLALVLTAGFILFSYLPLRRSLKSVRNQRDEARLTAIEVTGKLKQLPVLKKRLQELQEKVGNYEASIPEQRSLGDFLHQIASLMDKHKLAEQMVQPGKEIQTDNLNCIPVDIQCKGPLAQIFEFCKSLKNLDRLVRIEGIQLMNSDGSDEQVSMQAKAVIYYQACETES